MHAKANTWLFRPIPRGVLPRAALLTLWVVWLLVFWYATVYSDYPNQIHWAYTFVFCAVATLLFPWASPLAFFISSARTRVAGLREVLLLVTGYLLAFYVVSFWELYPGTTVDWGKFELVQIPVAINFYILGRVCGQEQILRVFHSLAVALVVLTIVQIGLDSDQIRYGYGWQLMLCLPASLMLRNRAFVAVALVVMLASQHKAALACALLGLGIVYLFARLPKERLSRDQLYVRGALAVFALPIVVGVVVLLWPQIASTIARFLPDDISTDFLGVEVVGEGVDISRELVVERSLALLSEYAIQGMGYMNFASLLGYETGLTSTSRLEREFVGINLHNSYMTWVIEGGLLVTIVVLTIFARTWQRIRWMLKQPTHRNFGVLAIAWAAACLLLACFHQLHALMQFWGTIALIFGAYDRARATAAA